MKDFKFINVMVDEDGNVNIERGNLGEYEWKGYINIFSGMVNIFENVDFELDECLKIDDVMDVDLFKEGIKELKEKRDMGVVIGWCIEYDMNFMLIIGRKEEIIEWLNREVED